jgi:peptidyl-tRNA hydrolase, PTH1 family
MKLVVGLGNPGSQYEQTRHNAGFRVVDKLAANLNWRWERHGRAILASGMIGPEKVVLVKPLTFMNLSGEAVGELARYYKIQPEDVLVVYDEMDLPLGRLRLRPNGSAAGHNGIESIIRHLHTNQFPRLRIGVGHPGHPRMETIDHVLGTPATDEHIALATAEEKAAEVIPLIIRQGVATTMNIINADPEAQRKAEERRRLQQERREQARLRREAEQREKEGASHSSGPDTLVDNVGVDIQVNGHQDQ